MTPSEPGDPVLAALDHLTHVLDETASRTRTALENRDLIRHLRVKGIPYKDIVPAEPRPLIVELLTETLQEISDASSHFRRAEARALLSEGLSMVEIARLFGVSRQRVATLLQPHGDPSLR